MPETGIAHQEKSSRALACQGRLALEATRIVGTVDMQFRLARQHRAKILDLERALREGRGKRGLVDPPLGNDQGIERQIDIAFENREEPAGLRLALRDRGHEPC